MDWTGLDIGSLSYRIASRRTFVALLFLVLRLLVPISVHPHLLYVPATDYPRLLPLTAALDRAAGMTPRARNRSIRILLASARSRLRA